MPGQEQEKHGRPGQQEAAWIVQAAHAMTAR
jgi:hypothetical protein